MWRWPYAWAYTCTYMLLCVCQRVCGCTKSEKHYLITVVPGCGRDLLGSKWTFCPWSEVLVAETTAKCRDLNNSDKLLQWSEPTKVVQGGKSDVWVRDSQGLLMDVGSDGRPVLSIQTERCQNTALRCLLLTGLHLQWTNGRRCPGLMIKAALVNNYVLLTRFEVQWYTFSRLRLSRRAWQLSYRSSRLWFPAPYRTVFLYSCLSFLWAFDGVFVASSTWQGVHVHGRACVVYRDDSGVTSHSWKGSQKLPNSMLKLCHILWIPAKLEDGLKHSFKSKGELLDIRQVLRMLISEFLLSPTF